MSEYLKTITLHIVPYGLAVRIPGFHPGGPGSTPGMGSTVLCVDYKKCLLDKNNNK